MNKKQLARLQQIKAALEQIESDLSGFYDEVEVVREAEQERYDARSDRWRESDKGTEAADLIGNIETLTGHLETAREYARDAAASVDDVGGES